MPTPKEGYFRDGVKLPGVTTVLKQKDSSGLISAANSLGRKGKFAFGKEGEWQRAADIGTATHAMIESFIQNIPVEEVDLSAKPAFDSFVVWAEGRKFTGKCEVGLVHPELPYGGTIDYIEEPLLFDWKTNSSLDYTEELYAQVGAYVMLAEAHGMKIETSTIVRFPKEGGKAEELVIPTDSVKAKLGRELFLALLNAYHFRAAISKKEIELGMIAKV